MSCWHINSWHLRGPQIVLHPSSKSVRKEYNCVASMFCYFCFLLFNSVIIEVRRFAKSTFIHYPLFFSAGFDSDFCMFTFSEILHEPTDLPSGPIVFVSYISFSLWLSLLPQRAGSLCRLLRMLNALRSIFQVPVPDQF